MRATSILVVLSISPLIAFQQPANAPGAVPLSISGRVTGANGVPLAGIQVGANTRAIQNGVPTFRWGYGAITDQDGRYRMTGFVPGDYYVVAPSHALNPQTRIVERLAPPPILDRSGTRLGYVTTAYGAEGLPMRVLKPIRVDHSDVVGIDIQMERRPVFDVEFVLSGAMPPDSATLRYTMQKVLPDIDTLPFGRQGPISNGRFTIPDLPDGTYDVTVAVRPTVITTRLVINGKQPAPVTVVIPSAPR